MRIALLAVVLFGCSTAPISSDDAGWAGATPCAGCLAQCSGSALECTGGTAEACAGCYPMCPQQGDASIDQMECVNGSPACGPIHCWRF